MIDIDNRRYTSICMKIAHTHTSDRQTFTKARAHNNNLMHKYKFIQTEERIGSRVETGRTARLNNSWGNMGREVI